MLNSSIMNPARGLAEAGQGGISSNSESALVAALREKDAEIARLRLERNQYRFFFDSSTSTQSVIDWKMGTKYAARHADRRGRKTSNLNLVPGLGPLSPLSPSGLARTTSPAPSNATTLQADVSSEIFGLATPDDPDDDEFRIHAINASGREDLEQLLSFASRMSGPLATPNTTKTVAAEQREYQKTLGFFDLAKAYATPSPQAAVSMLEGPVSRDNPIYSFLRSMRPYFLEAMLMSYTLNPSDAAAGTPDNLPGRPVLGALRFTRPSVAMSSNAEDGGPDVMLKCLVPPDVSLGGAARFCLSNTASRAEYEATRQLKTALVNAEAANKAKTTFVATISHELRTPLTAIIGFSRLLEDVPGLTEEEHGWAQIVRTAGDSLTNIINDLIDVSKIEGGKMDVRLAAFRPADFLGNVRATHHQKAEELGIEFTVVALPGDASLPGSVDVPELVVSDELRLTQVLHNLVVNAKKFTPRGGHVIVSVQAFARRDKDARRSSVASVRSGRTPKTHTLRFAVADTGIGLAPEKIPLLFKEFQQADASYARQFEGTGLGLFISKRIMELLGGRIGVDSAGEGQGCTFWIEIDYSPDDIFTTATEEGPLSQIRKVKKSSRSTLPKRSKDQRSPGTMSVDDPIGAAGATIPRTEKRSVSFSAQPADDPAGNIPPLGKPASDPELAKLPAPPVPAEDLPLAERLPLQILVVEDNIVNCKLVLKLLSKEGYVKDVDVATAENGQEAVDLVIKRRDMGQFIDCILMDIQMPVMDGLEATRRIRQELSPMEQPAIIALTANAMLEDREACFSAGMDAHLAKPVRARDLYSALEKLGNMRRCAMMADVSTLSVNEHSGTSLPNSSWSTMASSDGNGSAGLAPPSKSNKAGLRLSLE